jgi:hypothetical protein
MKDKITAILKRFDKISMQENVELMSYGEASEKIMGIIHSEVVGLVPAVEEDYGGIVRSYRSELLSAIEKKFKTK